MNDDDDAGGGAYLLIEEHAQSSAAASPHPHVPGLNWGGEVCYILWRLFGELKEISIPCVWFSKWDGYLPIPT